MDSSAAAGERTVELIVIPPRERSTGGLTLPIYSYFGAKEAYSGIQMLTPDEGVDFSKYLDGVVANLKRQWYRKHRVRR